MTRYLHCFQSNVY